MKKGLVLEGGAMRGMFTAGILDVFMENDIDFDGAVGVSAGAVFGCNYKSKQIGRGIRYNKKYCTDDRYVSLKSWITTGDLYGAEFSYHTLPQELDVFDTDAFSKSPMEFYVVCTDMHTGRAVYHKCTDGGENDIQWMRASASLPLAARPVELAGRVLSDGGTSDSIPVKFMEYKGYDKLVVKRPSRMMPVMNKMLKKYPNFLNTMSRRYMKYNKTLAYIEQQERLGRLFVIRPDADLAIGKVCRNPDELERVYQLGREKGLSELEKVKRYLEG